MVPTRTSGDASAGSQAAGESGRRLRNPSPLARSAEGHGAPAADFRSHETDRTRGPVAARPPRSVDPFGEVARREAGSTLGEPAGAASESDAGAGLPGRGQPALGGRSRRPEKAAERRGSSAATRAWTPCGWSTGTVERIASRSRSNVTTGVLPGAKGSGAGARPQEGPLQGRRLGCAGRSTSPSTAAAEWLADSPATFVACPSSQSPQLASDREQAKASVNATAASPSSRSDRDRSWRAGERMGATTERRWGVFGGPPPKIPHPPSR